ncbi:hypothetical protein PIB30_000718 [Stylosanthes scabra]|uniref:Uncharacterized protein n=1 Tax=Stylosanthes scabra TaxID=79078 RepID=A0ABU6YZC0_9FABA|nr:hypothetical protein [Stylosanthes scabra]
MTTRGGLQKEGDYQQRKSFYSRRFFTRSPNSSFPSPHTRIFGLNPLFTESLVTHLESYPQPSLPKTQFPNSSHPQPQNPYLRPTFHPIARKTVVPRHLGPGAPSERNSPSPPPRGPPCHRTTTARTPAPPPSSRGKPIVPQFLVSLDNLASNGLDFLDLFVKQGWLPLFEQKGVVYPDLVLESYSNISYQNGKIVSFVQNTNIILDKYKIAEALGYHETRICVFTSRGGAVKKQATRGKRTAEPSTSPRPHSSRKSSTAKKIKNIVKAMKEMIEEITNLVELVIRFSKDRDSQEVSDQRDLAKTKLLLQMTHQDILALEEETYLSEEEEDTEDVERDEEGNEEEEDDEEDD